MDEKVKSAVVAAAELLSAAGAGFVLLAADSDAADPHMSTNLTEQGALDVVESVAVVLRQRQRRLHRMPASGMGTQPTHPGGSMSERKAPEPMKPEELLREIFLVVTHGGGTNLLIRPLHYRATLAQIVDLVGSVARATHDAPSITALDACYAAIRDALPAEFEEALDRQKVAMKTGELPYVVH